MLQEASSICKDPSVLRRIIFAATSLHKETPRYWEIVAKFGFKLSSEGICSSEKVKLLVENTQFLDEKVFDSDHILLQELSKQDGFDGHPLGIVLLSSKESCEMCGGHLLVREDRPSFPTVYSEELGTVSGTHFRKHCSNHWKGCSFTQHYGYHQNCSESVIIYDDNCLDLPYFLSTHMTAFQMKLLHNLNAEILLGQISYKQKSEIYNYTHGYDCAAKKGPKPSVVSCEVER